MGEGRRRGAWSRGRAATGTAVPLAVATLAAALATAVPVLSCPARLGAQEGVADGPELARVVTEVEGLDALRSSLATTFAEGGAAADRETFRQVCRPVGERARRLAEQNGWIVAQLSEKYRNPAHAPDPGAERVLHRMAGDDDLTAVWRRATVEGREGMRYFRRITVEPACLACHGDRESRPGFVKEGYPRDRAHGFEVGDLRGVYSIFVPGAAREGSSAGKR